jgi:hypothetical protein
MSATALLLSVLLAVGIVRAQTRTRQCVASDVDAVCGCGDSSETADNCFAESPGRVVVMDGSTICDIDDSASFCITDAPNSWVSLGYSWVSLGYSWVSGSSSSSGASQSESSCCVPCTKTALGCPESSFAFATALDAGLCATVEGEPTSSLSIKIVTWKMIGTVTGAPADLNTAWTGDFTVAEYGVLSGVISKLRLERQGASIQLSRTGDCQYTLDFVVNSRKRQSTGSVAVVGGPAQLGENGGASGDPHLRSPTGIKFDFNGEANGNYSLFVAPQFQVNMMLAAIGPTTRFITKVGIVFGDLALELNAFLVLHPAQRARLVELGGRAFTPNSYSLTLELCAGHQVTLTAYHTTSQPVMNYLDVDVITPGCLDAFAGALGQTYTCKHVVEDVPFVWSHAQEESFRVPSLAHRSGAETETCNNNAVFAGQSSMLGSLNH